jgi:universal stress protein E
MQRFKNILCVVTPDECNETALAHATELAIKNQAQLTVVSFIESIPTIKLPSQTYSSAILQNERTAQQRQALKAIITPWKTSLKIQLKVLTGIRFIEIIRLVLIHKYDLVIKQANKGSLLDRIFGTDDMHLLRKCPCPVWLIKPDTNPNLECILAAVDIANEGDYPDDELDIRYGLNKQTLKISGTLAASHNAKLHIVNVWNAVGESIMRSSSFTPPEKEILEYIEATRQQQEQSLKRLINEVCHDTGLPLWNSVHTKIHSLKGSPTIAIPESAKQLDVDLVVMGTVARTGIAGFFMGNTAETILNQLDCSVLAIKPEGFMSPISIEH